jgi:hypothetical protein
MGEIVGFAYALLFGFIVPLTFFCIALLTGRRKDEMRSRERLAAAERGIPAALLERPKYRQQMSPLAGALVVLAVGVGFSFALWQSGEREWGWGAVPALIGMVLLIHWLAGGRDAFQRQQELNEETQRAYIDLLRRADFGVRPSVASPAALSPVAPPRDTPADPAAAASADHPL